uniref:Conserved oligomeric Golgi complex subunit 4 n=2 Tax=Heliothis virescens TaxID=7102 RepID=A0A2A4K8J4_HELVI
MSLSLLLEKYDVSTDEGLQKALNEIEKEESEVDEALSGVLSRACSLEGRLRAASQAYTKLNEVKTDAQIAADMVDKTAGLARDVSAKVRQLDLARSRVAECQRRVHDLIDLQLCSAGVEAAIKAHDYETGAGHVSRFLSMDPGSVAAARARGAPDPRDAMTRAANTLYEHLVRKFEEAARKEDEQSVERLFKLFPQIGRAEEGVDLLAKYLATQTDVAIRRACVVSDARSEAAVFADAVTRVVEAGGAGLQRARRAAAPAPGRLPRALRALQPHVCAGVRRVFTEMVSARRLEAEPARGVGSALGAEPVLAELALTHSRIWLYFNFIRRQTEADAATLKDTEKKACIDAVEKIIAECDLMRTAQDILAYYLALERYFLEESVNKALKMATPQIGVTTSSLVDDVFFIARKVIRVNVVRLPDIGGVLGLSGVCVHLLLLDSSDDEARLSHHPRRERHSFTCLSCIIRFKLVFHEMPSIVLYVITTWLGCILYRPAHRAVTDFLQRRRTSVASALPSIAESCGAFVVHAEETSMCSLPLTVISLSAARGPAGSVPRLSSMLVIWRRAGTANSVDVRLDEGLDDPDAEGARMLYLAHHERGGGGRECRSGWRARLRAAEALARGPAELASSLVRRRAGAAAAAFRARARPALSALVAALHQPQAAAWAQRLADPAPHADEMEDDADALPQALEQFTEGARAQISARAVDALLLAALADLAARAEQAILHHRYDRAPHAVLPTPRLTAPLAKDILARRTDFKMEDIKRVKL